MFKPSIIFLNGPENAEKRLLLAKLRTKFETSCVVISRKDLLEMFNAHDEDKSESYEWLVTKVLKNILNNGVVVLFDAFLPSRRIEQYVTQMKGLPCYWIGVFFKEYSNQMYDFSVKLAENQCKIEEENSENEGFCDLEDDSEEIEFLVCEDENECGKCQIGNDKELFFEEKTCQNDEEEESEEEEEDSEEEESEEDGQNSEFDEENLENVDENDADSEVVGMSCNKAAKAIFEFVNNNKPTCFETLRDVEFVARKRDIDSRSLNKNLPFGNNIIERKEELTFATPEEKREYKERRFRSLKNKYSREDSEVETVDNQEKTDSEGAPREPREGGFERRSFGGPRGERRGGFGSRDGGSRGGAGGRFGGGSRGGRFGSRDGGARGGAGGRFGSRPEGSAGGRRDSNRETREKK